MRLDGNAAGDARYVGRSSSNRDKRAMRPFRLLLLITPLIAPLACPTAAAEPQPPRRYARLEAMDTQARAAWVGAMLKRLDEANGVVLSPQAIVVQHARFQKMLAPLIEDQPDWQADVARFESELAISQRAAIEHLSRRYRVETYRVFHADRPRYEQRRRLLEQLLLRWQNADAPDAEQHKVVEWLVAATRRVSDPKDDWVPPLPSFSGRIHSADRAIAQSGASEPAATGRSSPSAHALLPDVNLPIPVPSTIETAELPGPRPSSVLAEHAVPALPSEMVRPETVPVSLEVRLPLDIRRLTPRPLHVAMRPSLDDFGSVEAAESAEFASSAGTRWRPTASATGTRAPTWKPSTPATASTTPPVAEEPADPLAFARMKIDRFTPATTPGGVASSLLGSGVPRTQEPGHLAPVPTTPLPPSGGHAAPSALASTRRPPASTTAPPEGPMLASLESPVVTSGNAAGKERNAASSQPGQSPVPNVGELASRIKGNNMAMRNLAAELYEDRQWDARALAAVLDQLAPLVARKDDLKLIRELIPSDQRNRVGDLESGSDLISDLGSKIARVRGQIQNGKFPGTLAERKAELDRLDQLSQRLAQLVFNDE
jgi:hypothetical protein